MDKTIDSFIPTQNTSQANNPINLIWQDELEPMVPSRLMALVDVPIRIYFDNLILAKDLDEYDIFIDGISGKYHRHYWELIPTSEEIGHHDLDISVYKSGTKDLLSTAKMALTVSEVNFPIPAENDPFSLLIVGDSTTHQSSVPNRLYELLTKKLNGNIRFVGTHHPEPIFNFYEKPLPNVFHEGYGGWTWERFSNHYNPDKANVYHATRSPFVFLHSDGPRFDLQQYFKEQNLPSGPDVVIFQLGINDTFLIQPDDFGAMEARLEVVINNARNLLNEFHKASPESRLLVQTPPYFTANESVFIDKYGESYGGADRHKRIVSSLIKHMIKNLSNLPGVEIVPTHLMLDRRNGYFPYDPGHPNENGSIEQALLTSASLLINPDIDPVSADSTGINSSKEMQEATFLLEREGIAIPKTLDIMAGDTQTIFWRNVIPVYDPGVFNYKVTCTCNFFEVVGRGVRLDPKEKMLGNHEMTISVLGARQAKVSEISFKINVRKPDIDASAVSAKILFVGDSLGHQSRFPNEVAYGLEQLGASISYIGTHRPIGANILHEQYGGWTFKRFLSGFGFDPAIYHTKHSPFVFPPAKGSDKPVFDVKRYFSERVNGHLPDIIHIQLGINDAFLLKPTDNKAMDIGIDTILKNSDQLVAALREAVPNAVISLGTVIPGNGDERAFVESYPETPSIHSEWRWRQVQNRMVRRMATHYGGLEDKGVYVVPTHIFLDTLDGYYPRPFIASGTNYLLSNAVHPNEFGDRQVAAPIHAHIHRAILGELRSGKNDDFTEIRGD